MADVLVAEALRAEGADEAAEMVRASCEPLPPPDDAEDFGACFDRFADAKVVLLGEATHGTSQFYKARAAITRRLIEKHAFSIVAVEAGWRATRTKSRSSTFPPMRRNTTRTNISTTI